MRGCCSHASSGSSEEDPTAAGSTSTSRDSHRGGADEDAPVISFPAIAEACVELGLCCPVTGRPCPRWEAAELKARYRDLVRVNHPDVNGGDHQTMERINLAYARLSALGGAEQAGFARWIAEEGEGGYDGYVARRRWTTATRGPRLSADTMQLVGAGLSLTVVWGAAWGVLSLFSPTQATGPTSTSTSASGSGAGEGKGKGSASGPASLRQRGPASGSGRGLSWVATATPRLALVLRPLTRIAMVLFSKYLRGVVALLAVGSVLRNVFPRVVV
ncbi:unnamed protein product [Phytomonas sp. EM1]|nr:unnamed protein product [Phytomonas sp. EM1]|eukprot:CCW65494.1 unnamed protein product [Phytomonas sp. isolate EM1]